MVILYMYLYGLVEIWWQCTRAGNDLKIASFRVFVRVTDGRRSSWGEASGGLGDTELVGHWDLRRVSESYLTRYKKP